MHLDEDGLLHLTDRSRQFTIIPGVDYPQEAENILIGHPAVYDVAIIGVPDADSSRCRRHVCTCAGLHYVRETRRRTPRLRGRADAAEQLPAGRLPRRPARTPTGKLVKRELQKQYS